MNPLTGCGEFCTTISLDYSQLVKNFTSKKILKGIEYIHMSHNKPHDSYLYFAKERTPTLFQVRPTAVKWGGGVGGSRRLIDPPKFCLTKGKFIYFHNF